ncbi:MAG: glycosyltransferase [Saprospiraceae bacterium]|nr:glycosyltransferase [Candidatus Vicinibacter affinis]MBP6173018.1 glycosyltransferase [Saprospiraceae bacterium]
MISGLITVYNEDVRRLVADLTSAFQTADIEFEIIALDDGSHPSFQEINTGIANEQNIRYVILPKNSGRSVVRNTLADMAKFPFLLFLDGDSHLIDFLFIQNYLPYLNPKVVLSGGRIYNQLPPESHNLLLHWKYGIKVESKSPEIRNLHPYLSFHSNNFIVPKTIIKQFPFEESLHHYGHEDSLWAKLLELNGISILHLANPVIHSGLDEANSFLSKSNQAVGNLHHLNKIGKKIGTPLEIMALKLSNFKLDGLYLFLYSFFERLITRNLLSRNPSLFFLQLMKLGVFIRHKREK